MNWQKFKQNIGARFLLRPPARSVDANGTDIAVPNDDYWILQDFTGSESFRLYRIRSGHVAELGKDHVFDFRSDPALSSGGVPTGHLVLKMQVVISDRDVRLIPNSRPGEAVLATASLRRRAISEEQRSQVLNYLSLHPTGTVGIASIQGDIEAHEYKGLLLSLFRSAGWKVCDMQTFMFFGSRRGLVVTIPNNASELGMPQVVATALGLLGEPVSGNRGDMAIECQHYVQVWHAP